MDVKVLLEIKLMLGELEASRQSVAEMLLYILNGHSDYRTRENSVLACLCSVKDFHYFRFVTSVLQL